MREREREVKRVESTKNRARECKKMQSKYEVVKKKERKTQKHLT